MKSQNNLIIYCIVVRDTALLVSRAYLAKQEACTSPHAVNLNPTRSSQAQLASTFLAPQQCCQTAHAVSISILDRDASKWRGHCTGTCKGEHARPVELSTPHATGDISLPFGIVKEGIIAMCKSFHFALRRVQRTLRPRGCADAFTANVASCTSAVGILAVAVSCWHSTPHPTVLIAAARSFEMPLASHVRVNMLPAHVHKAILTDANLPLRQHTTVELCAGLAVHARAPLRALEWRPEVYSMGWDMCQLIPKSFSLFCNVMPRQEASCCSYTCDWFSTRQTCCAALLHPRPGAMCRYWPLMLRTPVFVSRVRASVRAWRAAPSPRT
eukprot:6199094-Pleurochrysis_carterae.AAC.2